MNVFHHRSRRMKMWRELPKKQYNQRYNTKYARQGDCLLIKKSGSVIHTHKQTKKKTQKKKKKKLYKRSEDTFFSFHKTIIHHQIIITRSSVSPNNTTLKPSISLQKSNDIFVRKSLSTSRKYNCPSWLPVALPKSSSSKGHWPLLECK